MADVDVVVEPPVNLSHLQIQKQTAATSTEKKKIVDGWKGRRKSSINEYLHTQCPPGVYNQEGEKRIFEKALC